MLISLAIPRPSPPGIHWPINFTKKFTYLYIFKKKNTCLNRDIHPGDSWPYGNCSSNCYISNLGELFMCSKTNYRLVALLIMWKSNGRANIFVVTILRTISIPQNNLFHTFSESRGGDPSLRYNRTILCLIHYFIMTLPWCWVNKSKLKKPRVSQESYFRVCPPIIFPGNLWWQKKCLLASPSCPGETWRIRAKRTIFLQTNQHTSVC